MSSICKLSLLALAVVFCTSSLADEYNDCVNRILQSYPQPLKRSDKRDALVAISNNCPQKRKPMAKLEAECQTYLLRSKKDQGSKAIVASFKNCRELASKMEPAQEGPNCGIRICQKNSQDERCVDRSQGYFTAANEEYCSKWLPYSRCVLDAIQFNPKEPVYVYWKMGESSGKTNCADL